MPGSDDRLDEQIRQWVECALGPGAHVLGSSRLTGGLTAQMDWLTVRDDGGEPFDVVLRRWPTDNPGAKGLVGRELAALTALAASEVPAPELLAADETGAEAGVNCLLMTALPGAPLLTPSDLHAFVRDLAVQLAGIHAVPVTLAPTDPWGFDPETDLGWLGDPALARAAIEAVVTAPAGQELVLTHADYQHFNVLWQDQRLTGVVDWPMAGLAPRGHDVGHCRLNLAVLYSAEAAEQFLADYQSVTGRTIDPRSDLRRLLAYGLAWPEFIPIQVDGRAAVDGPGMSGRVTTLVRNALSRLG